jgi:hypothetical protein
VVSGVQLLCELGTLLVPLDTIILKRNKFLLEVSNGPSLKLRGRSPRKTAGQRLTKLSITLCRKIPKILINSK